MILRNKSDVSVTIRTMQGFKKIEPKKTLEIPDNSLLTALHPNLEIVKDGEIVTKLPVKSKKAEDVELKEGASQTVQEDSQDKGEQTEEGQKEEEQDKEEEQGESDDDKEDSLTEGEQVVLSVQEIAPEKILEELEQKLLTLQKNWEMTTRAKKKEQIYKEIQAIKVQIERITTEGK